MAVVFNHCSVNFAVSLSFSVILYMFLRSFSSLFITEPIFDNNPTTYIGIIEQFDGITDDIVTPAANVYNASSILLWARPASCLPFRPRTRRSTITSFIAFLLLTVDPNP